MHRTFFPIGLLVIVDPVFFTPLTFLVLFVTLSPVIKYFVVYMRTGAF